MEVEASPGCMCGHVWRGRVWRLCRACGGRVEGSATHADVKWARRDVGTTARHVELVSARPCGEAPRMLVDIDRFITAPAKGEGRVASRRSESRAVRAESEAPLRHRHGPERQVERLWARWGLSPLRDKGGEGVVAACNALPRYDGTSTLV